MTTQHEFFQANAVEGVLPDHLMGELLALPEGDTPFVASTDGSSATPGAGEDGKTADPLGNAPAATPAPSPAPVPAPAADPLTPAPAPTPVILAKDGIHTINFEVLEDERKARQRAEAEAARLATENEALKKAQVPAPAAAPTPAAPAVDPLESVDFGDYSDASMRRAVGQVAGQVADAAVARATAPLLAELQQLKGKLGEADKQAEVDATKAHFTAIYTAHPDLDSILESAEFKAWGAKQPAFMRPAIANTIENGSAQEVIELFDTYKGKAGTTTPPAPPPAAVADAAALAAARIAAAKSPVPTSLSEIPAGTSAHHDEVAAMLEMTPTAVMAKFEGLTPRQIADRMDRLL